MQVCSEETWQHIVKLQASLPRARVSHLAEGWDRRTQLKAALPLPESDWFGIGRLINWIGNLTIDNLTTTLLRSESDGGIFD